MVYSTRMPLHITHWIEVPIIISHRQPSSPEIHSRWFCSKNAQLQYWKKSGCIFHFFGFRTFKLYFLLYLGPFSLCSPAKLPLFLLFYNIEFLSLDRFLNVPYHHSYLFQSSLSAYKTIQAFDQRVKA